MRPRCKCGNIAGYWYAPMVYVRMRVDQYVQRHCYCGDCADTENWAEYEYVGFHKKDWRWFKLKDVVYSVEVRDAWMDFPYYTLSHMREGKRYYLGMCRSMESVREYQKEYVDVEWKEEYYKDIRLLP